MTVEVLPKDQYNLELVANVHPPDWRPPTPPPRYNLVVIGAGTAGLVTAAGAAGLGARVALIERYLLGGDCLNVGCVPSKCVIRSSRVVGEAGGRCRPRGARAGGAEVDFGAVMERMHMVRARLSHHDSALRFRGLGVDVFLGDGRFADRDTVVVDGTPLRFKKAVIATGARAHHPPIPWPGGERLSHQRERVRAGRPAATPRCHRRGAHRLRAGPGLPPPRLRRDALPHGSPHPEP
jgi:glycine/D-amino acid oxidase-like deaminating enzyme